MTEVGAFGGRIPSSGSTEGRRSARDVIVRGAANATSSATRLVLTILAARGLGRGEFEYFAIALAAVDGGAILFNLGLPTGVAFYAACQSDGAQSQQVFRTFLLVRAKINLIVSVLAFCCWPICDAWIGRSVPASLVFASVLLFNVVAVVGLVDAYHLAAGHLDRYYFSAILPREIGGLGLSLAMVKGGGGAEAILGVLATVYLAQALVSVVRIRNEAGGYESVFPAAKAWMFVRDYWPTSAASIFQGWLLVPAIAAFFSRTEAGDFAIAFRLVNLPSMVIPVGLALTPLMSRAEDYRAFMRYSRIALALVIGLFSGAAALVALVSGSAVSVFGGGYQRAADLLVVLAPLVVIRPVRDLLLPIYLRMERLRLFSVVGGTGVVCMVALLVQARVLERFLIGMELLLALQMFGLTWSAMSAIRRRAQGEGSVG